MFRALCVYFALLAMPFTIPLAAEEASTKKESKKELAPEETVVTAHSVEIQGKKIDYEATAGTMHLKDDQGNAKASVFYVAYTKRGEKPSEHPVTFCFNGGPGSSSVWLHMGVFGPKRVALEEFGYGQPPYHTIDNEYSILDLTDLVFIDPVSTGYSRPAPGENVKQFHGVEEDVKWVSEFIRQYTTHNGRWDSPKFLAGESYGTTRAAAMAAYLHEEMYMFLNGVVLISSILDFQTHDKFDRDNDLPFITTLPSFTAAAWYHKKLPAALQKLSLQDALKQAETFAMTEYALALLKGDLLSDGERLDIAQKYADFSGLRADYVLKNNMRISAWNYFKELLYNEDRVIGRFDSRYIGIDSDTCSNSIDYDPSMDAVTGPFTGAFNQYVWGELNWKKDDEYKILTNVFPWDYGKEGSNKYLNVAIQLKHVMMRNPACRVFVANGYYDLATPYFSQDYTFKHLALDPSIRDNVDIEYYEAGHMMYTNPPSLVKMRKDLEAFFHNAMQPKPALQK